MKFQTWESEQDGGVALKDIATADLAVKTGLEVMTHGLPEPLAREVHERILQNAHDDFLRVLTRKMPTVESGGDSI